MMRFSLQTLFGALTAISLIAGLTAWLGVLGLLIASALLGFVAIGYGVAAKERATWSVGIMVVAGVAAVLAYDMSGRVLWDGEFILIFDVTVVDAQTGSPLTPATISFEKWDGTGVHEVDEQGRAKFSEIFPCGGTDSVLRITKSSWETIPLDWYWLIVTDEKGRVERFSLAEAVGRKEWPRHEERLPPIRLEFPQ